MNRSEIGDILSRLGFRTFENNGYIEVLDSYKSSRVVLNGNVLCGDRDLSVFVYSLICRSRVAGFKQAFLGVFDAKGNKLEPIKPVPPTYLLAVFIIVSAFLVWFIGNAIMLALSELALSVILYLVYILSIGRRCRRFRGKSLEVRLLRLSDKVDPSRKWELLERPWKALSYVSYIEYVSYHLDFGEGGVDICVADDHRVNAYVFPPYRLIIFTTSLLARLDPNEVKSVVVHELAHLKRFHGFLSFSLMVAMVLGLVFAFSGGVMSLDGIIMMNLSLIGLVTVYSAALQGLEFDADRAVAKVGMSRDFSYALVKAAWNSILSEYLLMRSNIIGRVVGFGLTRTHPTTIARLAKLVARQVSRNGPYEYC